MINLDEAKIINIRELKPKEFNVLSINSIKYRYPKLRQDSKTPTFALTYGGTYKTLMNNIGLEEFKAKKLEENYHRLYSVSDEWVHNNIIQASKDGYVTLAFGLRLDTPILKQVVLDNMQTPYEAMSESRTAGNALGQSWCMLNNRAASAFLLGVRTSEYRLDIKPCAHIHDAQYYLIRDNIDTLLYLNNNLTKAVSWQNHPLIQHDKIKISGQVDVFYPNWSKSFTLPVTATKKDIKSLSSKHIQNI